MTINKSKEIAFSEIKRIIIDIVLVECHCVISYLGQ